MTVRLSTGKARGANIVHVAVRIVGFICMMFAISLGSSHGVQASEVQEQRYLFDEDFNWITPEQRGKFLADVKTAGFNAIIPVIWRGKGVLWPSALAPMDPAWSGSAGASTDPLKELITQAHEMGVKVIPWFTVAHRLRDFFPEFHEVGTPDQAFNIHDEGFRRFIVKLMMEVVDQYDVDGINLDYVRAKGICKTPSCRIHYNDHMKRDLLRDAESMWKNAESGDSLARWNAAAVTKIIEEFSGQARARRPKLPISVDSHPVAKWTYLEGASSIDWANRGLIDMIFDMQYMKEIDVAAVNAAKSKLADPARYTLLVGNFEAAFFNKNRVWARDAVLVTELLKKSRLYSQQAGAVALYEYRFLTSEQIQAINRGPFYSSGKADSLPSTQKSVIPPSIVQ